MRTAFNFVMAVAMGLLGLCAIVASTVGLFGGDIDPPTTPLLWAVVGLVFIREAVDYLDREAS